MLAGVAASALVLDRVATALLVCSAMCAGLPARAYRRVATDTPQQRRPRASAGPDPHNPTTPAAKSAPGASRRSESHQPQTREVTAMSRTTSQGPRAYGTAELVADAGFVVAAFIALVGAVVCVIATLTTIVLAAADALVPEAPIVAALRLLTAGFFGAMAVARAEGGGIALPGLTGHAGPKAEPQSTTARLRAGR
jgi:hypothetical protein